MRTSAKPNAKLGQSAASMYRCSVRSAASDIEALVDAYGVHAIIQIANMVEQEIAVHGDSIHNWQYNIWLNQQPLPIIRKQNRPENKRGRRNKETVGV